MRPLRHQVVALFSLTLTTLFGLTFWAVYATTKSDFLTHLDSDLLALAKTELASALDGPGRGPHLHVSGGPQKGVLFQPDGPVLANSPGMSIAEIEQLQALGSQMRQDLRGQVNGFRTIEGQNGRERVLVTPAPLGDYQNAFLVLSAPFTPIERDLGDLQLRLLIFGLGGTVVGVIVAQVLAQRLTRELESTASLAARVSQGQLEERMEPSQQSSEIHDLQKALNHMLDSLHRRELQHRQFVADASHELRSPIQAIRGTLEVSLRRPRESNEYRTTLQIALGETLRLQKLSEQLLMLAQADLQKLELQAISVDVRAFLDECLTAKQGQAQEKELELRLDCPSIEWVLDPDRLSQCLHNLLDNAIRHSPTGGKIDVRGSLQESDTLVISVQDQGPGLHPPPLVPIGTDSSRTGSDSNWIFERFTRLDPSRHRSSGNLGLGLAITREIVELHGGTIAVHSVSTSPGAFFEIRLPRLTPLAQTGPESTPDTSLN